MRLRIHRSTRRPAAGRKPDRSLVVHLRPWGEDQTPPKMYMDAHAPLLTVMVLPLRHKPGRDSITVQIGTGAHGIEVARYDFGLSIEASWWSRPDLGNLSLLARWDGKHDRLRLSGFARGRSFRWPAKEGS